MPIVCCPRVIQSCTNLQSTPPIYDPQRYHLGDTTDPETPIQIILTSFLEKWRPKIFEKSPLGPFFLFFKFFIKIEISIICMIFSLVPQEKNHLKFRHVTYPLYFKKIKLSSLNSLFRPNASSEVMITEIQMLQK